jgi:hypothetical protein
MKKTESKECRRVLQTVGGTGKKNSGVFLEKDEGIKKGCG